MPRAPRRAPSRAPSPAVGAAQRRAQSGLPSAASGLPSAASGLPSAAIGLPSAACDPQMVSGMEAVTAFKSTKVPGFAIARIVAFLRCNPASSRWKRLVARWYHKRKLGSFWGALGAYLKSVHKGKLRRIVWRDANREQGWARLVLAYRTLDTLSGVFGLLGGALKKRPHRRLRAPARRRAIQRIMLRDSI